MAPKSRHCWLGATNLHEVICRDTRAVHRSNRCGSRGGSQLPGVVQRCAPQRKQVGPRRMIRCNSRLLQKPIIISSSHKSAASAGAGARSGAHLCASNGERSAADGTDAHDLCPDLHQAACAHPRSDGRVDNDLGVALADGGREDRLGRGAHGRELRVRSGLGASLCAQHCRESECPGGDLHGNECPSDAVERDRRGGLNRAGHGHTPA